MQVTFLSWVERIPEYVASQRPILCVYHAEALMLIGNPIDQVASRLEGPPEYDAVQVLKASYLGNVELSKKLSERVLDQLPSESAFLRGIITSSFGVVLLLSGEVDPAIQAFQASADINRKNGILILEVIALSRLGQLHQVKGELRKAEGYLKQALELSINWQGEYLPVASMPLAGCVGAANVYEVSGRACKLPDHQMTLQGAHLLKEMGAAFDRARRALLGHVERVRRQPPAPPMSR